MKMELSCGNSQSKRFNVFRKTFAVIFLGAVLSTLFSFQTVWAQSQDTQSVEKVRTKVQEMGTNKNKRVEVKLKDNTKLKGFINSTAADSFTILDSKTNATQTLAYSDVKDVKKSGGISPLTWGIIAGVAVAAVIVSVTVIKPVLCDGC